MRPIHSMLFIPAHKLDWVRKVARHGPDAVIPDLEDAVPPALKDETRALTRVAIPLLRDMGIAPFVRINAWHEGGSADGMPLGSVGILPLPETAIGLYDARQLAAASRRCQALMALVGGPVSGDVSRAMGFLPTLECTEQRYLASKTVLDSRTGGASYPMASIIGTRLDDLDAVRLLCRRATALGFAGAVPIHPAHAGVANEVFAPTPADIDHATGLLHTLADAEAAGSGAVSYRGQMIDHAMRAQAQQILALARRRVLPPTA
ncbi:hypothetical protein FOZ76_13920 [Verticiella sediminum]|uniref:HpcH/HpaI aldolase/citrate lyase domain-containing protein n=1 Tax=Verticiella sediminum TaxID=1247510 RepID=A0A556AKG2_9BURK|nr:aldolase/citrate lyase family protein [Verticiella sediminum]TSH93360.1 hypothetical protein FOZ76_13920 [Verticiella sediminum]